MPSEGFEFWRASSYRLLDSGSPGFLEAVPGEPWRRSAPTDSYRPAGKTRKIEAGPHLDFLRLKRLMEGNDRQTFDEGLISFANRYGLLGLFHESHSAMRLPGRKLWVAPEAVIRDDGGLVHVDPATEGTELLLDLLDRQGFFNAARSRFEQKGQAREAARSRVAAPSEVTFQRRSYRGLWRGDPTSYALDPKAVGWEEAKSSSGGLLLPTEDTSSRVGVLATREYTEGWRIALLDFPSENLRPDNKVLKTALNARLSGVSPYSPEKDEGMGRGWRCTSLHQAMYLMLWLDLTGGRSVVKCEATGCPNWFRQGSQPDSKYCPHPDSPSKTSRCALREAQRESRRRKAETTRTNA